VRAIRLETGRGIGTRFAAVEHVSVPRAGSSIGRDGGEIARAFGLERNFLLKCHGAAAVYHHFHLFSDWRPYPKVNARGGDFGTNWKRSGW